MPWRHCVLVICMSIYILTPGAHGVLIMLDDTWRNDDAIIIPCWHSIMLYDILYHHAIRDSSAWLAHFINIIYTSILDYNDVIMRVMASQITSLTAVWFKAQINDNIKPLRHWLWIYWWAVHSPHKGPVTWTMFPFDDVIMVPINA